MKVTVICSDDNHPVVPYLKRWEKENSSKYYINILSTIKDIKSNGDILFLVSCSEIVKLNIRKMFRYTLVLHASDLPSGRGWSPHIWDVIEGKNNLTLSLINAEDSVDTGDVWKKTKINLVGNELFEEINDKLFQAEIDLMEWACENIDNTKPQAQPECENNSYRRKRTPEDSELNADKSIRSQFNLLRVCDSKRFPAYVMINNTKYHIKLEKADGQKLY